MAWRNLISPAVLGGFQGQGKITGRKLPGGNYRGKSPGEITGGKLPEEITGGVYLDPTTTLRSSE